MVDAVESEAKPTLYVDRVRACAERIARHDAKLRAFITPTVDSALEAARRADERLERGEASGPLGGMVVAIKDNIDAAGVRCTAGSAFFADRVPAADAPVVARLRTAGAVLIGKANLHEFAYGGTSRNEHYGACRNPWNPGRLPGGSSGGSAVAVAAGMCDAALGSDTGGSIRVPAALNGVCGLRPTAGAVPNRGSFPVSPPHDTIGPLARRVEDVARVHAAIAGPDPDDPTSSPRTPPDVLAGLRDGIGGVRVLVPTRFAFEGAEPEVEAAVRRAAAVLESLGAVVEEGDIAGLDQAQRHLMPIIYADAASCHRERLDRQPERFGREVFRRLQPGLRMAAVEYAASLRWLEGWRHAVARLFAERTEVVLTPTVGSGAPPAGEGDDVIAVSAGLTRLTWAWPAARVPALSLPCGFTADGLPIGLQLAAARWGEPLLLRVGCAYQSVTDWHAREPPLWAGAAGEEPAPPIR